MNQESLCCKCIFLLCPKDKTCVAFIDGIPYEVWSGETPHDKHIPGDHGLKFKRREE